VDWLVGELTHETWKAPNEGKFNLGRTTRVLLHRLAEPAANPKQPARSGDLGIGANTCVRGLNTGRRG
jgi:hypothetical protein